MTDHEKMLPTLKKLVSQLESDHFSFFIVVGKNNTKANYVFGEFAELDGMFRELMAKNEPISNFLKSLSDESGL